MLCRFGEFQFDCDQQTLSKNNKLMQLSEKPCALLTLLLKQPNKIHTKAEILEYVWPDRVVTEQVIFQNISHLRAILGDDSIKTFSKKGYQWQLPVEILKTSECEQLNLETGSKQTQDSAAGLNVQNKVVSSKFLQLTLLVITCAFILYYLLTPKSLPTPDQINLLKAENRTHFGSVNQSVQVQQLFDSPYTSWSRSADNKDSWVIATREYKLENHVVLRFAIQGKNRGINNYIYATDRASANKQLDELLLTLAVTNYFNAATTHAALAELLTLNSDNLLILEQVARLYFKQANYEQTYALVEQILNNEVNLLRVGLINLFKSEVAMWDRRFPQARESVDKALFNFKRLGIEHLESLALLQLAWSHLVEQNFREGMQVLNQVAHLARRNNEPLQEVQAHLNQAFMAAKLGEIELSYNQLNLAEGLLNLHELSEEHKVHLLYDKAWLTESKAEAISIYSDILAQPYSPIHEAYYYAAATKASQYYIKNALWEKALNTVKSWQRLSFQLLIKAQIAFAQSQLSEGMVLAEESHQQALIEYDKIGALDAALLVLKYQENKGIDGSVSKFEQYIMKQSTRRWLSQNSAELKAAKLSIP